MVPKPSDIELTIQQDTRREATVGEEGVALLD
jgi:hypothetical protein